MLSFSTLRLAAILAVALGAAPLGAAEEMPVTQVGPSIVLDTLGHTFSVPLPDWLSAAERLSPDVIGLVESNYYGDPVQAFVEFFPKGQSIEDFSTTYSARITKQPGRSLEDYRRAAVYGYSQPCEPALIGVFYFGEETADFFPPLGFVCGAFRNDIKNLRGQGELVVTVFKKTEEGVAVVYQEWRGPAFDPSNPGTWPIAPAELQARADQLQADSMFTVAAD